MPYRALGVLGLSYLLSAPTFTDAASITAETRDLGQGRIAYDYSITLSITSGSAQSAPPLEELLGISMVLRFPDSVLNPASISSNPNVSARVTTGFDLLEQKDVTRLNFSGFGSGDLDAKRDALFEARTRLNQFNAQLAEIAADRTRLANAIEDLAGAEAALAKAEELFRKNQIFASRNISLKNQAAGRAAVERAKFSGETLENLILLEATMRQIAAESSALAARSFARDGGIFRTYLLLINDVLQGEEREIFYENVLREDQALIRQREGELRDAVEEQSAAEEKISKSVVFEETALAGVPVAQADIDATEADLLADGVTPFLTGVTFTGLTLISNFAPEPTEAILTLRTRGGSLPIAQTRMSVLAPGTERLPLPPIPLPASGWLMIAAAGALVAARARRRDVAV